MLYYLLFPLHTTYSGFNVFRYITFRAAMAALVAAAAAWAARFGALISMPCEVIGAAAAGDVTGAAAGAAALGACAGALAAALLAAGSSASERVSDSPVTMR